MDGGSWRAAGPGDAGGDPPAGDWRTQLQSKARQRIVNKVMETLERHLPIPASEGLNELKKIAVRFEEKIYTAAMSQIDYLRKISLKMLSMEIKTQNPAAINQPSLNSAGGNQSNVDPEMDGGSWRPVGQGDAGGDPPAGDWRTQLLPEAYLEQDNENFGEAFTDALI
ncbi:mediator of RNA polymerase II transcription subunit 15a-like [Dioscorea cayenensis subsp. rotundata]|uniref:Mediator of RNA polymerase II transcription subunit 15a-like n=1 Tax=Dioscorea cayennensis subsp. rotundata TaxID=55577 RepID=A0AB40CEY3_DIOCR|nr:mediator of RNA polymerase II transcription subunit 15a-like [Dioscorea cayenensis subsp. rotundata]